MRVWGALSVATVAVIRWPGTRCRCRRARFRAARRRCAGRGRCAARGGWSACRWGCRSGRRRARSSRSWSRCSPQPDPPRYSVRLPAVALAVAGAVHSASRAQSRPALRQPEACRRSSAVAGIRCRPLPIDRFQLGPSHRSGRTRHPDQARAAFATVWASSTARPTAIGRTLGRGEARHAIRVIRACPADRSASPTCRNAAHGPGSGTTRRIVASRRSPPPPRSRASRRTGAGGGMDARLAAPWAVTSGSPTSSCDAAAH
jgi:hypothetical protein